MRKIMNRVKMLLAGVSVVAIVCGCGVVEKPMITEQQVVASITDEIIEMMEEPVAETMVVSKNTGATAAKKGIHSVLEEENPISVEKKAEVVEEAEQVPESEEPVQSETKVEVVETKTAETAKTQKTSVEPAVTKIPATVPAVTEVAVAEKNGNGECPQTSPVYEEIPLPAGVAWHPNFTREVMPAGHDFQEVGRLDVISCCFWGSEILHIYYKCTKCGREYEYLNETLFTDYNQCEIVWTENNNRCEDIHYKYKECLKHNDCSDPYTVEPQEHEIYVECTERNECAGIVVEYYRCKKCLYWNDYKVIERFDTVGHQDLNSDAKCDHCGKEVSRGLHNCCDLGTVDIVVEEGNCVTPTKMAKACEFCLRPRNFTEYYVSATGHDSEYLYTDDSASNCTLTYYRCKVCGEEYHECEWH